MLLHPVSPLATLIVLAASSVSEAQSAGGLVARVDHLVYATPDLARGVEEIEHLLGVRAIPGGRHPGRGTRNALIALGPNVYLEIIAPDPDQPAPPVARAFGLDTLKKSHLATWAAKTINVDSVRRVATDNGIALGEVIPGRRQRPDGVTLSWRSTNSTTAVANGIVPFFIDWGDSPHPSHTAPQGATLIALRAEHPDDRRVRQMLDVLGLGLPVSHGSQAALIAVIDGRLGRVELR